MDFEMLFFMYVIWSDQFNLVSIITYTNLVVLTLSTLVPQICTPSTWTVFNSGTMKQHIVSFINIYSQFAGFKHVIYLF